MNTQFIIQTEGEFDALNILSFLEENGVPATINNTSVIVNGEENINKAKQLIKRN